MKQEDLAKRAKMFTVKWDFVYMLVKLRVEGEDGSS